MEIIYMYAAVISKVHTLISSLFSFKKSEYTKGATEAVLEEGQRIRWPDEK